MEELERLCAAPDYSDNGLYYDGHDIVNAFMWGVFVGALIAGAAISILSHYGFAI